MVNTLGSWCGPCREEFPHRASPTRTAIVNWIDTPLIGQPNTLFYDEAGKLVYVKQGPYETEEDLAADIDRYALGLD